MNPRSESIISPDRYEAVIFDLDGVVTRTARLHARAWKRMFDEYLARSKEEQSPFDEQGDYRRYVDGKPRYDGVKSFLLSRGIDLPQGQPDDPPDRETVCGLGNRKNVLFLELLKREGAQTFDSTLALIRALRRTGIRTAVISSSRNCAAILKSVGALDLFDVKVDGVDAQRLNLQGKPAPDIFLAAARQLGVRPDRAVVVEDALAGVAAGRTGGFALVVGVDRSGQAEALRKHGADLVVSDLAELQVARQETVPAALESLPAIAGAVGTGRLALFLDFDGTLTPIVERPEQAVLTDAMRTSLRRIAGLCTVAVVSGRDLQDVRERVGVDSLHYAGSHGFDIGGPGGARHVPAAALAAAAELEQVADELQDLPGTLPGVLMERKRFALAIHYRMVEPRRVAEVHEQVDGVLRGHGGLRKRGGKKVIELLPDIDWDKGAAVNWLLETLGLQGADVLPMYIGDDETDEDAFRTLQNRGIGIVVADAPRPTSARYWLPDPQAVGQYLDALATLLEKRA